MSEVITYTKPVLSEAHAAKASWTW